MSNYNHTPEDEMTTRELAALDPREVHDADDDYDLSDSECSPSDHGAMPTCDWCGGDLDEVGGCLARCRQWTSAQPPQCAWCGSGSVVLQPYDFGIDRETGYHDAGTKVVCAQCGRTDEADA